MNSNLTFRKESIQRSSHSGETLNQARLGIQETQGSRAAHDQRLISLTTLFTLTQA